MRNFMLEKKDKDALFCRRKNKHYLVKGGGSNFFNTYNGNDQISLDKELGNKRRVSSNKTRKRT